MACILKYPKCGTKGVLSLTNLDYDLWRSLPIEIKKKTLDSYYVGLHPNYYLNSPIIDSDLSFLLANPEIFHRSQRADGRIVPINVMNLSPSKFRNSKDCEKHIDFLAITRWQEDKNVMGLLEVLKELCERDNFENATIICPVKTGELKHVRRKYDSMFSGNARSKVNLITPTYDYPVPFDLSSISTFYRISRVYLNTHLKEKHGRVVGFAHASGLPVVCFPNIAEGIDENYRMEPYYHIAKNQSEFAKKAEAALVSIRDSINRSLLADFAAKYQVDTTFNVLKNDLCRLLDIEAHGWVSEEDIDRRIARHHQGIDASESYKVTLKHFLQHLNGLDNGQFKSEEEIDADILLNQPNILIKNALLYRRWLFIRQCKAFAYKLVSKFKVEVR